MTVTLADPDNITENSVTWQWYKGSVTLTTLSEVECIGDTTPRLFHQRRHVCHLHTRC